MREVKKVKKRGRRTSICVMLATVHLDELYFRHSQASNVSEIELCMICTIFIGVVSITEHPVT